MNLRSCNPAFLTPQEPMNLDAIIPTNELAQKVMANDRVKMQCSYSKRKRNAEIVPQGKRIEVRRG